MKFADELSGLIRPHPDFGIREVEADSVDAISVGSNGLLFRGEYLRDGADLIVRGEGETLIVHDYFTAAHRPKLVAPNGASLSDAVIDALARPVDGVEVAQAGAPTASDATAAIGRVQTLSGSATVVRNGVSVALGVGDLVYKGDVVQTGAGSSLAISFLDGTLFSLAAGARMVLSEMVYSANGADNHSLFNLVQGSIHFVAGKVAKTGDMKVGTPLATMGIRGTYVGAEIDASDGTSRVSVITEPPTPEHPEGYTGAFDVYSGQDTGNLLFRVVDPNAVWTVGPDGSGGVSFRSDPKTVEELAREAQLAREVFRTLAEAPRLPVFTGPSTGGGAGSSNEPGQFGPNPTDPFPGTGNPAPSGPLGPTRPDPILPGPGPQPGPNTPEGPPLVVVPSDPDTGLALTLRSVALAQGDVRVGLGEQSLLAGVPSDARLIAVRGPASSQDIPIAGSVTLQGRYGVLTLHGDGTYTYRAVFAASLGEGQNGADVFGLTIGRGSATATTTLRFDVAGTNDAPVVSGPMIGLAHEDGATALLSALAHASDIDAGTRLDVVVPSALPAGVRYDAQAKAFRLDPSDAAYQSLAAGETRTVTVHYGVSDGLATTPASVSWTVTGANDAPVVTGAVAGTAVEDGAAVRLGALANASDVDAGTSLSVVGVPAELPPGVTYDAVTKTFRLDPSDGAYQGLAAGQTRVVTVQYGVSDGNLTTAASVSWTVTGVNDAPSVAAALTSARAEGAASTRLDLLAGARDIDGDRLSIADITFSVDGAPASSTRPAGLRLTDARLTLDPSDPAFDALAQGETRTIVVRYTIGDGHGGTVAQSATLIVTGTNDAPVVTGAVVGAAREGGTASRLDALAHASDVDAGTRLSVVDVPAELPPGVSYDAETRTFRLDPSDPAYQSLAAGETRTVTVGYGVSDGLATTPASVSWTVTGANDAPVMTGAVTGTAVEDGGAVRLAALANASDVDAGARLSVVDVPAELPPGVTYDAETKTFLLDPSDPAYQSLAAGETRTVTVSYGVSDGLATTPAFVSWTVTGTNDAPVVSGAVTGAATEDGAAVRLSALANAADVDAGTRLGVVEVPAELPPGVTYDAVTKTFRLDPSDLAYQNLAAGQSRTVTVGYGVSDGLATTPASVSWTVTGTNDAPTVAAALTREVREGAAASSLDLLAGAGDIDAGDRLVVGGVTYAVDGAAATATAPAGLRLMGSRLTLDPSDPAFDALAQGETRTIVVRYTIEDGHGGTVAQSATLTVTGTNDAPAVTGPVTGDAVEDGAAVRLSALAHASDVDAGTRLRVVDLPSELPPGVSYDANTGAFRLDPSDLAYQGLGPGETRTITVRYGVSDGLATTPASVSWTVTGVNDAPAVVGPVTGKAVEDGAPVRLSALARASDADAGSELQVVDVPPALPAGVRYDAETKTFWLDPSDAAFQGLGAGQTRTVTVNYGISDGLATTPASVSWTVTGANDAPVVSGPVTGAATEDGAAVSLNALRHASDIDAGTQLRIVNVPAELPRGVRYDAATQSFRLDPSDAAYQSLAVGQTRTVTVGYGVSDGIATTPASVSWTVTGTNDAPVVTGAVTGTAVEDGAAVRLSALARASDIDSGARLQVVDVPPELPPGVRYDAETKAFWLDPSDAAYQSLAAGETRTVTVGYGVSDGTATTPASVSWTVTGVNDAPRVTGPVTGAAREDGTPVRLDGLAHASDVDTGTRLSLVNVPSELPPGVSYDAATHSFRLDPGDPAYQHLAAGQSTTVTVTYGVGDGSVTVPASVTWTVTGTNDAPVLEAAPGLSVTEQPGQTGSTSLDRASGHVAFRDADTTDTHRASVTDALTLARSSGEDAPAGLASSLAGALVVGVDEAGHRVTYGFSAPDGTFDFLAAGETLTVRYTLAVDDRNGGGATVPVVVTVTGTNDRPTIVAASTTASGSLTAPVYEVLSKDLVDGLGGAAGFGEHVLAIGDDNSSEPIDITSVFGETGLDFFGRQYEALFINNNGNITFAAPSTTFTPQVIDGGAANPIIAAFWADVQTITANGGPTPGGNSQGTNRVYYDLDSATGTLTVTWDDVGYYKSKIDKLNAFQIQLIGKGGGDFDIVYRYENINWTTGDASTGKIARAGYSAGDGVNYYELPSSGDQGKTLALPDTVGNSGFEGVYVFEVRNGQVVSRDLTQTGIIAVSDPDLADVHRVESVAYTGPGSALGRLTVESRADATETGGQFAWTYAVDPNVLAAGLRPLGAGETKVETFDVVIGDGHGGHATQTVSITLRGTNDAPMAGGDRTIGVASGGAVALTREDLSASDPDALAGPLTYTIGPDANPHGTFTIGDAGVTRFTQADIDAGRVVYRRDATLAGHTSDTVAFTLDDGAGGVTQGSLSVTVTGPYTVQDNVVRASDDAGGDLDIPIEAILFNDRGSRPLSATGIRDAGDGHVGRVTDRTVTVTEGASTQTNGAFTYRAQDTDGPAVGAATVFVNVSTAAEGASVAVGAGQDDDVLFASRHGATVLNGNEPDLSGGAARTGHDVYVFTQTPPESGAYPIHEIASFSAGHDAIALPFLDVAADGGPAEPEGIDGLVQIRGSAAHGYDLSVSWNLARGFQTIAHFDAGTLQADDAVTVIWNGRSAAVAVTQNSAPTVSEPLTSDTREGAEVYDLDLGAGASDADGDALTPTGLRCTVDGAPAEGLPWGLSLDGARLTVDPGHEGFADLADGETRTIVVDYTLDDGHGGTVAQRATITVAGTDAPDAPLPTWADNVVLASHSGAESFTIPVEALLFNDVGADGVRPSYVGITQVTATDIDRYAATLTSEGGTVTVSPAPRSDEPEAAFTYRAYDGTDRGSEVATVRVSLSAGASDGSEAFGSGRTDDILIASPFGPTTLDGNTEGSLIRERTGHDVFVFTQDPAAGERGAVHTITDILSDNDAIDLTFLDGSGASAETIGDYVVIQRAEIGYDLYARTSTASDFGIVAHIDSILLTYGDGPSVDDTVVVIWRDHFARVAVPGGGLEA